MDPPEMPGRADAVASPTASPRKRQRWEAVHRLNAQGWTVSAIADHHALGSIRRAICLLHNDVSALPNQHGPGKAVSTLIHHHATEKIDIHHFHPFESRLTTLRCLGT